MDPLGVAGRPGSLLSRALGWTWSLVWLAALHAVSRPWHDLGGVVDERLRWLEWFAIAVGLAVGYVAGGRVRDLMGAARSTHRRHLRRVWLPVAAVTAAVLVWLRIAGPADAIGVVTTAFLAYWAGLDLGIGALPLMQGLDYRFDGPIEPDPDLDALAREETWVPPWERP